VNSVFIGRKLLQSVGFASPDDASISLAIEANDAFIARLKAIRDGAKGLTIDLNMQKYMEDKFRSASMKKRRRRT
jgi:hypothetical protein